MIAVLLLALLALAWVSALCSGTETAFYRASPVRLRALADAGDPAARRALALGENLPRLVNETLIGNNIVTYLSTTTFAALWSECGFVHAAAWTTALLTPALFVLGEVTPKQFACSVPDAWAMAVARPVLAGRWLSAPLAVPLTALTGLLRRFLARWDPAAAEADPRARLLAWFEGGVAEHALTREQHRMARRIIALSGFRAADAAVAVSKSCAVAETESSRRAMARMAEAGPGVDAAVLVDAGGRATGRVALLGEIWRSSGSWDAPVRELSRTAPLLSPTLPLEEVLEEFGRHRARVALVGTEGRITGVLTARDLLARLLAPPRTAPSR